MNKLSNMAVDLVGSQILELAEQIKQKIREGEKIYNLTIGDFNPDIFPVPKELIQEIAQSYQNGETNYPTSNGLPELRETIAGFIKRKGGFDYSPNEILVSSGARPLIFASYLTLVDPGEKVLFPLPSWNNHFYSHISSANAITVKTRPEDNFLPTADLLAPHLSSAAMIALCSPLNPTGTVFTKEQLAGICDLIIKENKRREGKRKPLYLLYDQIYWNLTYGDAKHYDPISLRSEIKPHTILIDGLSKAFAATGLRVGWAYGPSEVIAKMKLLLAHVGSWSSRPVQAAVARYLSQEAPVDHYLAEIKRGLNDRLNLFYEGFQDLKKKGYPVDAISPQAALYLTVKLDFSDFSTSEGDSLKTGREVYKYLLNEAGVALVPFYAFGLAEDSIWYRLSVGTAKLEEISEIFKNIEKSFSKLKEKSSA